MGRIERVDSEIQKLLSRILNYEVKDPRIDGMITVHRAETTSDLKHCKVHVSALGCTDKLALLKGLKSSSGYIKSLMYERLNIRAVPDLTFVYDDGLEHSMLIEKLIKEIHQKDES